MRRDSVMGLLIVGLLGIGATNVAVAQRYTNERQQQNQSFSYQRGQQEDSQRGQQDYQRRPQEEQQRYGRGETRFERSRGEADRQTDRQTDRQAQDSGQRQRRSQSAQADRRQQQAASRFIRQYDENRDGRLSRNELPRRMSEQFARLDRNDDGRLSQQELAQRAARMSARVIPVEVTYVWFTDAQRGRLELNDLQQAYNLLQKIDENEDGQLTRNELQQQREQVVSQWIDSLLERADDNGDDEISRQEAQGTLLSRRFDRYDRDNDGQLSRSDLRHIAGQGEGSFASEEGRQREQRRR